jgi:hypothetical protein
VPTYTSTIAIFISFSVIFLSLGIALYVMSDSIQHLEVQYDTICTEFDTVCKVELTVEETIPGPVYLYYELNNFYQNHRRYVKSRSYE